MSSIITIPAELERKIADRAAAQGKDFEQFALEALKRAAESTTPRELFADVREQIEASGISDEELGARIETALTEA